MAHCRNGHQMDRYARACPTCGAGRDPKWHPANLRNEHDHEARRAAHMMLMTLLAMGLIGVYVAFHSAASTPTSEVIICKQANALLLNNLATSGPEGAFSERFASEDRALTEIDDLSPDLQDEELRAAVEVLLNDVTKTGRVSIPLLSKLVQTCKAKKYPMR